MAEIVGAIGSIITICEAVAIGLRSVSDLLNAPAEIAALQEQVQLMSDVVTSVLSLSLPQENMLQNALSAAQIIIDKMKTLINAKLRRHSASRPARWRSWLRYKSQILKLGERLREARQNISAVVNIHVLSSTRRLEGDVTMIRQLTIQTSMTVEQYAPRRAFNHPATDSQTTQHDGSSRSSISGHPNRSNQRTPTALSVDRLEMLPSIEPEALSPSTDVPELFAHFCRETESSRFSRVNMYTMLFATSRRQWRRCLVSITLNIDSPYWEVWKVQSGSLRLKQPASMPAAVMLQLRKFLASAQETIEHDSHVAMFLGSRPATTDEPWTPKFHLLATQHGIRAQLEKISNEVHHWGCARYNERELADHRPLYRERPNASFIAWLGNRWVLQYRFTSNKSQNDATFFSLRALHCLQGRPHINPFIGIVRDCDSGVINSFVCELPAKGILYHVMTEERPVSWARRIKWCKQIVEGLAGVHSRTLVFGAFVNTLNCGVAIDSGDNAVLYWGFQETQAAAYISAGRLPPEYRPLILEGSEFIPVTNSSDIFQLGLILWGIVFNRPSCLRRDFCDFADCPEKDSPTCSAPHADPVELPMPEADIPTYIRVIISACRAHGPQRPTALELLNMFPPGSADLANVGTPPALDPQAESSHGRPLIRVEDYQTTYDNLVICSRCTGRIRGQGYHCDICNAGDYDLCSACFQRGCHCQNHDHYLHECLPGNTFSAHYSNPGARGIRTVLPV